METKELEDTDFVRLTDQSIVQWGWARELLLDVIETRRNMSEAKMKQLVDHMKAHEERDRHLYIWWRQGEDGWFVYRITENLIDWNGSTFTKFDRIVEAVVPGPEEAEGDE